MGKWLILIGVVLLLCVAEWIREIHTFQTTHYKITSPKLNGLEKECKIVFLSDLHNNSYGKNNERLLQAVMNVKPDYILIGGDMVIGRKDAPQTVAEAFVKQLTSICPVYYANGNHEFRMKINPHIYGDAYAKYKSSLEQAGVVFLENSCLELQWKKFPIRILGLEIPKEGYKKFSKAIIPLDEITNRIGQAEKNGFQILLAHNPIYMDLYREWGADLVLSGHIHGGVVRIPFVGGVISPQFRLFPKYSGEYKKLGNTSVVVSKGLGTHTIKMRFMNPAEVVVLHIEGENK